MFQHDVCLVLRSGDMFEVLAPEYNVSELMNSTKLTSVKGLEQIKFVSFVF